MEPVPYFAFRDFPAGSESAVQEALLQQWLRERNIYTAIHYPVPVHLQPAYRFLGYRIGDFPVAEELAQTSLSLPLFPGLSAVEQERVVEAVRRFFI